MRGSDTTSTTFPDKRGVRHKFHNLPGQEVVEVVSDPLFRERPRGGRCRFDVRALSVLCLVVGTASADELPTIDTEHPPTLRITSTDWSTRIEHVDVAIRSAPEPTFVSMAVTGRERTVTLQLDVPAGTKVVGLGVDGANGAAWGRAMPVRHARDQHLGRGGALVAWDGTSADEDHVMLSVHAPATIELALHLPPLQRLAIATTGGILSVDIEGEQLAGKQRRVVVDLSDLAGTTGDLQMAHVTERVALVAAPSSPTDFLEHASNFGSHHMVRDLDKAMIRRRMKWFRPGLRRCFIQAAQWSQTLRSGGAVVSFMIVPDGTVAWARTSESDLPDAVNACLVEQVKTWEFPAADSNVLVNYPLDFHAYE